MSMVSAPRRPTILLAATAYGASVSSKFQASASRIWVIVEPGRDEESFSDSVGQLRVGRNSPATGRPERYDLGQIASVRFVGKQWDIAMADGMNFRLVQAPCVCGAGAIGNAGPSDDPHYVSYVRTETLPWWI